MNTSILEELQWRQLVHDCTHREELAARLAQGPLTLYAGFDPTADSLHVGHLVPLLALRRFQLMGHRPIALAGGATGLIGDPSGRTSERQLLSADELAHNVECIKGQLQRLLDFSPGLTNPAELLDNASWTRPIGFLDFLRDVGKHFTINVMIAKESVRARLEDRDSGLSFTEFSYMLLQAHDFHWLERHRGCLLQIGGSDQWGNITAGIELCRRKTGTQVYGLTLPLVTRSDGTKFGKSSGNNIWLDPSRTSPYRLYQYFLQVDDREALRFLGFFTFIGEEEILELGKKLETDPGKREAQRALARALTDIIHGPEATADCARASEVLFGGSPMGLSRTVLGDILQEIPSAQIPAGICLATGWPLADALVLAGLSPSKGQARKDIAGGGIYINGERCSDSSCLLGPADLLQEYCILLRKGKKTYTGLVLPTHGNPPE